MQAQQASAVTNPNAPVDFYDPRREKVARGDSRCRIRVRLTGGMQLGDNYVPPGEHEITIWTGQLAAFKALCEPDPDAFTRAISMFERGILEELKKDFKQLQTCRTLAEARAIAKQNLAMNEPEIADELRRLEASTPDSPQAQYRVLNGRDVSPLLELKVLEENIPEAPVSRRAEEMSETADVIAKALVASLGPALGEAMKQVAASAAKTAADAVQAEAKQPKK